jgi:hypothetical protein
VPVVMTSKSWGSAGAFPFSLIPNACSSFSNLSLTCLNSVCDSELGTFCECVALEGFVSGTAKDLFIKIIIPRVEVDTVKKGSF